MVDLRQCRHAPPRKRVVHELRYRTPAELAPVIEIGSFCGLSTNVLAHLLTKRQKPNDLLTADAWHFENSGVGTLGGHATVTHQDYREFARDTFIRNVRFFSGARLPHTVELDSDAFFQCWDANKSVTDIFGRKTALGGPISFMYIDGNHTYEYCKRDFVIADRWLAPGGLVLFDDTDNPDWGVGRVVREALRSGRYELIKRNPNALLRRRSN